MNKLHKLACPREKQRCLGRSCLHAQQSRRKLFLIIFSSFTFQNVIENVIIMLKDGPNFLENHHFLRLLPIST